MKVLQPGSWLSKNQALMLIVSHETLTIEALANLEALSLLKEKQKGLFIPEPLSVKSIPLTLSKISYGSLTSLGKTQQNKSLAYMGNLPSLDIYNTSALGGIISVRPGEQAAYEPEENLYKILFESTQIKTDKEI